MHFLTSLFVFFMRQERDIAISPASVVPSSVAFLMILSILIRVNIAERKNGRVYADIADTEMDTPVAINIGSYVKTYENKIASDAQIILITAAVMQSTAKINVPFLFLPPMIY